MFSADEIVVQAARQGLNQALEAAARAAADKETRASKRKLAVSPAPNADQTSAQSASSATSSISAITTSTTSSANKARRPEPAQIPSVGGSAAASLAPESEETPTAVQLAEDPASPDHEFLLFLRIELKFQRELIIHFMDDANYISISDLIADLLEDKTKLETDTAALDLAKENWALLVALFALFASDFPRNTNRSQEGTSVIPSLIPPFESSSRAHPSLIRPARSTELCERGAPTPSQWQPQTAAPPLRLYCASAAPPLRLRSSGHPRFSLPVPRF